MEITHPLVQTVTATNNVLYSDTVIRGNWSITHRQGSGLVTIKGVTNTPCRRARYKISFGANIGVPTGGTVGPISLGIHYDGEPLTETEMIVVPANEEDLFNVHSEVYVEVPAYTSATISVANMSGVTIIVQNANLIVDRTGTYTIGTTDPSDRCIYIANNLDHDLFLKVLIHELGHVTIISYQLDSIIHKFIYKEYWYEAEEWLCNYIAIYGVEIYRILNELNCLG